MAGRKSLKTELNVFKNGTAVGCLTKDHGGEVSFKYDQEYLRKELPAISRSLPLTDEIYRGELVVNYFDNLLPDNNQIRKSIASKLRIGGSDSFSLLFALGRDCIGALQLIPNGMDPSEVSSSKKKLSTGDIGQIIHNLKTAHLGITEENDFRISLAGAQEKTALTRIKNTWYLPEGFTPTTHILKPAIGKISDEIDMSESVENEWLCLEIIKQFGVPVNEATVESFGGMKTLVVKRFDREISDDKILRIPQEDFCQITGTHSSLKYESDGGPGIVEIMKYLNESINRDGDRERFLKTVILFQLLGATDGHAKNFSLISGAGGWYLSPIYDVISVCPILAQGKLQEKKVRLAMGIGDNKHKKLKEVTRRHYHQTAKESRFIVEDVDKIIDSILESADSVLDKVKNSLPKDFPKSVSIPIFDGFKRGMTLLKR